MTTISGAAVLELEVLGVEDLEEGCRVLYRGELRRVRAARRQTLRGWAVDLVAGEVSGPTVWLLGRWATVRGLRAPEGAGASP